MSVLSRTFSLFVVFSVFLSCLSASASAADVRTENQFSSQRLQHGNGGVGSREMETLLMETEGSGLSGERGVAAAHELGGKSRRGLNDRTLDGKTLDEMRAQQPAVDESSGQKNVFSEIFAETPVELGERFKSQASLPDASRLKHFGMDFFQQPVAGPDFLAQVGPDYVVGPGDTFIIDLWGSVNGRYEVSVDRSGQIVLPKAGVVHLWGQSFAQARETIRKQIEKYYTNFEVNITLGELRSIQIFLVGEAKTPGTFQVSSVSTLMTALSALGGPSAQGSLRNVQLIRQGSSVATLDFYDFFLDGDKSGDVRLQSGDTIFIPLTGPLVGVSGNVRRPGVYELKGGETLPDVLALAGGAVPTAYLQKVQVTRVDANRKKVVLDLDLNETDSGEAVSLEMQDRDLVTISPITLTGGYVTLEGHVVRNGDYQFAEGMRLSDLITPYDNLLPDFYPDAAQILRVEPPHYRQEILTVNLAAALAGDAEENILLKEYDRVTVFSRDSMEETQQVRISGAVLNPGTYRLFDQMSVRDLVAASGSLKRMAYRQEAELTRIVPDGLGVDVQHFIIDLELALKGDPEHNVSLEADDHLAIRAIPNFGQREMVEIRGEVLFPGTYPIVKGETLSSVLRRAGGFTEQSYLRGAVFNRESLKEHQRQRVQQLIHQEEEQIARVSAEMASGALDPEDVAAAESLLQTRQELVDKLKGLPVTGRMVISLKPVAELEGSDDDILLVDGDVLTVPPDPRSVSVLGEVYNPTSLLYRPGKDAGYYLKRVGGSTRDADADNMFIVRADGTVESRNQYSFLWVFNGFGGVELYPGDTVLVPEEFKKSDFLKELKDISTIIYQMALGAAAVASF